MANTRPGNALPTDYVICSNDSLSLSFGAYKSVRLTVTKDCTIVTTVPPAGSRVTLIILTSGTSTWTVTFGAGFKSTGTLATGTADAKVFVLSWISDGTNLYESSRTAAMAA